VELPAAAELLALTFSVAEPGAFTELELSVLVTPAGAPLTLSATAPLKPFRAPTLTVELPLLPVFTVSEVGLADTEKSGGGGTGFTCTGTVSGWLRVPLVPVMVTVYEPTAVELVVVTFKVAEPGAFTELELNVAVTPAGATLTLSATLPLKPLSTPTFNVELVLLPTITDSEFGLAARVKSGSALMFNIT